MVRTILKNESIGGLYKGLTPALTIVLPRITLQWLGLGLFKPYFDKWQGVYIPYGSSNALTGVATGTLQATTLVAPLECLKVRMQTDLKGEKYNGMLRTASLIIREEGFLSIYSGLWATIARQAWGLALKFSGYGAFKDLFAAMNADSATELRPWQHAASGFGANIIVAVLNSPPDVVKTRLQDAKSPYTGTIDCIRKIWKQEGLKSFFRGSTMRAVRIAPGGAVQFSVSEAVLKWLKEHQR